MWGTAPRKTLMILPQDHYTTKIARMRRYTDAKYCSLVQGRTTYNKCVLVNVCVDVIGPSSSAVGVGVGLVGSCVT